MVNDDGSVAYSDSETICSGSIDFDTGCLTGTVQQLAMDDRTGELSGGFRHASDESLNTFTVEPRMEAGRGVRVAALYELERRLVSQVSFFYLRPSTYDG